MIMSMKVTRLHTYWSAEEAHSVIEFLEVLHDQLWEIYGDTVVDMLRETSADKAWQEAQVKIEFDEDIKF
jgi:hypothetical protein